MISAVLHKAPSLKYSARFCRGCFENLEFMSWARAQVMHPYESNFLARLSDKFSPKSACDGKTMRSSVLRSLLLFAAFSFKKKKWRVHSLQGEEAVLRKFLKKVKNIHSLFIFVLYTNR